jgi:hypothetical protein
VDGSDHGGAGARHRDRPRLQRLLIVDECDKGQWLSRKSFVRDRSMTVAMNRKTSGMVAVAGWFALLAMSGLLLACSGADGSCEEREQSVAQTEPLASECDDSLPKTSQATASKTLPGDHDNRWPSAIRVGSATPR